MATTLPLPPQGTPVFDRSGQINILWGNYYLALQTYLDSIVTPPVDAQYWLSTADPVLTNERNIGALASGYLKIATTLGIATPSTVTGIPASDLTGVVSLSHGGTGVNLSDTGGASQVLRQSSSGAAITVSQLTSGDISGDFMAIGGGVDGGGDGALLFIHPSGILAQDASNLFWDAAQKRLGLGLIDPDARVSMVANDGTVQAAVFSGSGLDDATSGGSYSGGGYNPSYQVIINTEGTPDTFDVLDNETGNYVLVAVPITGAAQVIDAGVTIQFGATTGHTSGDTWDIGITLVPIVATRSLNSDPVKSVLIYNDGSMSIGGPNDRGQSVPLTVTGQSNDGNGTLAVHNTNAGTREALVLIRRSGDGTGGLSFVLSDTAAGGRTFEFFATDNGNSEGAGKFIVFGDSAPLTTWESDTGYVGIVTTDPQSRLDLQDGAMTIKKMMSDPDTPATDCAVLWGRDDGGGKFEYMIKFDDASEVQIAVQP